jgi:hypothetical protein
MAASGSCRIYGRQLRLGKALIDDDVADNTLGQRRVAESPRVRNACWYSLVA